MRKPDRWLTTCNTLLLRDYGIDLQDAGFPEQQFLARFGNQPPEDAVEEFATKYGLQSHRELNYGIDPHAP